MSPAQSLARGFVLAKIGAAGSTDPSAYIITASERQGYRNQAHIMASQPARPRGNPVVTQNLMRQGEMQMARGKMTIGQFSRRLATSTQRLPAAQAVAAPASLARGSGGGGYSGAAPRVFGQAPTVGTSTTITPARSNPLPKIVNPTPSYGS